MENIGNGASESTTEKAATVESLKPSPKSEKKSTRGIDKFTSPEEASQLLLSALDYCKKASLKVEGYNDSGGLVLFVSGLELTPDGIRPVTPSVTPSESAEVTPFPALAEGVTPNG